MLDEIRCTTRYSLVSGLAISKMEEKYLRVTQRPHTKNTDREPFSILTALWVLKAKKVDDVYVSGSLAWFTKIYIKFAYSNNGLDWHQTGKVCIKIKKNER